MKQSAGGHARVPSIYPLANNLADNCENCNILAARQTMSPSSMLVGPLFMNVQVAAVHVPACPIGGIFHIPYAARLSNALMLSYELRFNALHAADLYAELDRRTRMQHKHRAYHIPQRNMEDAEFSGWLAAQSAR